MANELLSMASQFSGLPMDSLIGAPLNAAADANGKMALTQTKFLLDTCFKNDGNEDESKYSPIMIEMALTRGVISPGTTEGAPTIKKFTTKFELPLLTIVPINSLAIDDVNITFEMEVKSSFSEEKSKEKESSLKTEGSFEAKIGGGWFSASVKGSVSREEKESSKHSTHYEKSNSAKYTLAVHAGQLPLPKGVNVIIDAFSKAIQPIELKATE